MNDSLSKFFPHLASLPATGNAQLGSPHPMMPMNIPHPHPLPHGMMPYGLSSPVAMARGTALLPPPQMPSGQRTFGSQQPASILRPSLTPPPISTSPIPAPASAPPATQPTSSQSFASPSRKKRFSPSFASPFYSCCSFIIVSHFHTLLFPCQLFMV